MVNRKLKLEKLARWMTTAVAAEKLGVSRQTIVNACTRMGLGRQVQARGDRSQWILSNNDVMKLATELQDGPGRPA